MRVKIMCHWEAGGWKDEYIIDSSACAVVGGNTASRVTAVPSKRGDVVGGGGGGVDNPGAANKKIFLHS